MKRVFFAGIWILISIHVMCQTYDGYVDLSSEQRIYYKFDSTNNSVSICPPNNTNWINYTKPIGALVVPDSILHNNTVYPVTSIGDNAFSNCSGLSSVIIPDAITSIGRYAFNGCSGMSYFNIPNTIDSINEGTFFECSSLSSIIIPNAVTFIGKYAFEHCHSLTTLTIPNAVTYIGNEAFGHCTSLSSVVFNADSCIFAGNCANYTYPAFNNLSNITSFTFGDNVKIIPNYLCYQLAGLTSVTIGNNVTSIGESSFWHCTGLSSVTIPAAIKSIGSWAFVGCTGLTAVMFEADSCTYAGDLSIISLPAFHNLENITDFFIGENVKVIPANLCYGLHGLTAVTIPESVSFIGSQAMNGCTQIENIYMRGEVPPSLQANSFEGIPTTANIFVPCNSISNYQNALYWGQYNIAELFPYFFSATSSNQAYGSVQVIHSPECSNAQAEIQAIPNTGFRFVQWSDGNSDVHRFLAVIQDTTITAEFAAEGAVGIGDENSINYQIYSRGNRIIIDGADNDVVQVFDIMGRLVNAHSLPEGIYMVKVGKHPARKVVVIR